MALLHHETLSASLFLQDLEAPGGPLFAARTAPLPLTQSTQPQLFMLTPVQSSGSEPLFEESMQLPDALAFASLLMDFDTPLDMGQTHDPAAVVDVVDAEVAARAEGAEGLLVGEGNPDIAEDPEGLEGALTMTDGGGLAAADATSTKLTSKFECDFKKCDECGKLLKNQETLRIHRLSHSNDAKRKCPYCELQLNPQRSGYTRHLRTRHQKDEHGKQLQPPFQCDAQGCGHKNWRSDKFREHMIHKHPDEATLKCGGCKFICCSKVKMSEHRRLRKHKGTEDDEE